DVADLSPAVPRRDEGAVAHVEAPLAPHRVERVVVARSHEQPAAVDDARESMPREHRVHRDDALARLGLRGAERLRERDREGTHAPDLAREPPRLVTHELAARGIRALVVPAARREARRAQHGPVVELLDDDGPPPARLVELGPGRGTPLAQLGGVPAADDG